MDNGITLEARQHIFDASMEAIRNFLERGVEPDFSKILVNTFQRLYLIIRYKGTCRVSAFGEGHTFAEQLSVAIRRVCVDSSFGGLTASQVDNITLEIWIQTCSEPVPLELRATDHSLVSGLFGVEIWWNDARGAFDPSVMLDNQFRCPSQLLSALCRKAGLFDEAWREKFCHVEKHSWIRLCQDPQGKVVEFFSSRARALVNVTRGDLQSFVNNGAKFLMANQRADGEYCYIYQALEDRGRHQKVNTVRASGCAYAVASSIRVTSPTLKDKVACSARRAIRAVLARTEQLGSGGAFVREDSHDLTWGKLGSTALAAVALLELNDPFFYPDSLKEMLIFLKRSQRADGFFNCFFGVDRPIDSVINYYPGEALLALAISGARGDAEALECCRRAFLPYRQHFRHAPSSAFVGWHVDAWSRLAIMLDNEEYAHFAFEQLDWLLPSQISAGNEAGGFVIDGKRPGVSSTVYTEALVRGAALAYELDLTERHSKYTNASREGLSFCSRLQLNSPLSNFLPDPHRALGGVTGNLRTFQVRADNVQHMMTMAQAAFEKLECFGELN